MSNQERESKYKPGWEWLGRSLSNYKAMHKGQAERSGCGAAFQNSATLTQARIILFGAKTHRTHGGTQKV